MHRRVGQQQVPLVGDLHLHAGIYEGLQSFCAVAAKNIGEALRIGLQKFRAPLLDGHLPRIPKRGCEQDQRGDPERDVAESQRQRG
jgi:hypothetical protein